MRLKNVKKAAQIIEKSKYITDNIKFNNNNPIHIEIGMGKGDFIINMALKYPNINFIGIEMYDSVIVRAVQKLEDKDIDNLKLLKIDATNIEEYFNKNVDTIYLNFSDPWPKKRHSHRRLSSDRFLKRYDNLFKDKKTIIMKTDNRKLFEYSVISFTDYNYKIKELSLDLHNDEQIDNVETEYEKKFVSKGFSIYMIKVEK